MVRKQDTAYEFCICVQGNDGTFDEALKFKNENSSSFIKVNIDYSKKPLGIKKAFFSSLKLLNKNAIDSVGAGDVMHALISMCLNNKIDEDLSLFISSIAAAHSVGNLGNSNILNKSTLLRSIKYLLK